MIRSLFQNLNQNLKRQVIRSNKEIKPKGMDEIEKMNQINLFESMEVLEPRCPKCEIKMDYGVNTTYSDKLGTHVCNECGSVVR